MKPNPLFLLLLLAAQLSVAQISYENRIEIELKNGYTSERLYEFGQHGLILSSKKQKSVDNQKEWKYEKLNLELQLAKTTTVLLSNKMRLEESFTNEERMHSLFKDRKGNFSLVTVEASDLSITTIEGVLPKKAYLEKMTVLGDYAFFSAAIRKNAFLIVINWKTGEKKLTPIIIDGIPAKKTSIIDLQILEKNNEIFAYAKALINKKESNIYVVKMNGKGEKMEMFNLSENTDKNIITVTASKIGQNKYTYIGTYSTKHTYVSEGLFFGLAENNALENIEFYNFLDLKDFLSYLPEKRQEKIEKKKKRKEKKGKELKFNYRIVAHDIIPTKDGYLFLGEAYYPTYRTETYTTTTTVNGVTSTVTNTRSVFDGYQYTHAIISKFDTEGKIVWDKIFELWPSYKPFYVKKFISIEEKNQHSIKLVFASYDKIVSKSINFDGSVIQDEKSEPIKTNFEGDKTKYSSSNIDYWYGNYFIAYGFQTIKNVENKQDSKIKRKVYFISKIRFD